LRERVVSQLGGRTKTIPSDAVMTSGSGLDPHITLDNALDQLDGVADERSRASGRDRDAVRKEIEEVVRKNAAAPFVGLAGVAVVNVLEVNLELKKRFEKE
jgi:K+-transporting ATPase ATPase C chain